MLASALVSIQVAPELAETGKLCPKKDIIILKFNQLLERLVSRVAAHNASDLAAYEEQQKAVQDWLDVESTYRSASEKAAKAKEGASFAEAQYEQWNAALTATKERQEKEIKDNIAVKAGNDAERELIKELLGLIDELQSEDSSTDKQAVLQQFRQKVSKVLGQHCILIHIVRNLNRKLIYLSLAAFRAEGEGGQQSWSQVRSGKS
jgi:hypothetical protein